MPLQLALTERGVRNLERIPALFDFIPFVRQIRKDLTVNNESNLPAVRSEFKFVDAGDIAMMLDWVRFFVGLKDNLHRLRHSAFKIQPPNLKIALKRNPLPIRRNRGAQHTPIGKVSELFSLRIAF